VSERPAPARPCTHGDGVSRFATETFALTRAHYAANLRVPWHDHESTGLTFVAEGSVRETIGHRTLECGANTLVTKPPDARHIDVYGNAGATCLIIEIVTGRTGWIREQTVALDRVGAFEGGPKAAIARRLLREMQTPGGASALAVEGLVFELIATAARTERVAPRWLQRAKGYVDAEFRAIRGVGEVAAVAGMHPVHVARMFRAHYGVSVSDSIRRLRLEWAADVLATSATSLFDVALEAGFADQSHFTRMFSAHFGMSPGRYRALHAR
jgi:AraC family transcriptional regulator